MIIVASFFLAFGGSRKQHGIGGHSASCLVLNGLWGTPLCFAYTQQGFLIVMIDLDVPAPQLSLYHLFNGRVRIGADDVGRFSIQPRTVFAEFVFCRHYDQPLIGLMFPGSS